MIIAVKVQRPGDPRSARVVGQASDELTIEEVARAVGVPDGCLIDGKLVKSKTKIRHWQLVANVRFREHWDGGGRPRSTKIDRD